MIVLLHRHFKWLTSVITPNAWSGIWSTFCTRLKPRLPQNALPPSLPPHNHISITSSLCRSVQVLLGVGGGLWFRKAHITQHHVFSRKKVEQRRVEKATKRSLNTPSVDFRCPPFPGGVCQGAQSASALLPPHADGHPAHSLFLLLRFPTVGEIFDSSQSWVFYRPLCLHSTRVENVFKMTSLRRVHRFCMLL